MPIEDYYADQSTARGIKTEQDVLVILEEIAPIYERVLRPWLPRDRSAPIYEAACGPGILLRWLRGEKFTDVRGSDVSAHEIGLARASGYAVAVGDSLADLRAQPEGSLACIVAIDFIEHLPREVFVDFIAQARRVLRSEGTLILRAPNGDSPLVGRNLFNDVTHVWAYTSTALRSLAKIHGFREVDFVDDTVAAIRHGRWLWVPVMRVAQVFARLLLRLATREQVELLGSSYYVCLRR